MERVPVGVENYLDVINTYYVDKTMFIKEVIDYFPYRTTLITRPRRFGKSLTLSMLEYFFTNKGDYSYAFKDKAIAYAGERYLKEANAYPVIHLNMKNVKGDTFDSLFFEFRKAISKVYESYPELESSPSLNKEKKKLFLSLKSGALQEENQYTSALSFLIEALYAHYEKRVIVLLDEYDTPINEAYQKGFYQEAISLFSSFYSSAFKGEDKLYMGILTGVLEIQKESIFSDLNNLDVYSIADEELSEYFGFTEEEVKRLFAHLRAPCPIDDLRKWYGGYGAGKESVFNPWSILNYANRSRLLPYWTNTSSNLFVQKALLQEPSNIEKINAFINNENMPFLFQRGISYRDLDGRLDVVLSLLVHAGYFSVHFDRDTLAYTLGIPNLEARGVFEKEIILRNTATPYPLKTAEALRNALLSEDAEKVEGIFEKDVFGSFSYYDLRDEKDYQNVVTGIFAVLFDDFIVRSEVNAPKGRCDIMIGPKNNQGLGVIVEMKKYSGRKSERNVTTKNAIVFQQIDDHQYCSELVARGCKKILKCAFLVFDNGISITFKTN